MELDDPLNETVKDLKDLAASILTNELKLI
jgi:hypothetical protein